MKKRVFSLGSLLLILLALFLFMGAFGAAQKGSRTRYDAMTTSDVQKQQEIKSEANRLSNRSWVWGISSWSVAAAGVICLFVSYRRDEPASRSIQIILLAFYVLLQFGSV
jgi:hypothetical protein